MSSDFKAATHHTSLSPELSAIAARELNETPTVRTQSLMEMRKRLQANKRFAGSDYTDRFLLRFLRCKKFDVARSVTVFERYHSFREENKELFADLRRHGVREVLDGGLIGGMSCRDNKRRAVMVGFPGRWDPDQHSLEDMLRALILQLEHLIESDETQITGIVLIADFKDFSLTQSRSVRPWYFQKMTSLVQNAFPARFKGVYILHQPWYINLLLAILRRFLSDKMNSRIHLLGDDLGILNESFDMSNLPSEFGGDAGYYDPSEWVRHLVNTDHKKENETTLHSTDSPTVSCSQSQ